MALHKGNDSLILSNIKKVRETEITTSIDDISFALNSIKNETCDLLTRIIRGARSVDPYMTILFKESLEDDVESLVGRMFAEINHTNSLSDIPELDEEKILIQRIKSFDEIKNESDLLLKKTREIRSGAAFPGSVIEVQKDLKSQAEKYLNEIRSRSKEAEKILDHSQKRLIEKQISDSALGFSDLFSSHKEHERNWFFSFVASCFFMLIIILSIYNERVPIGSNAEIAFIFFKKILLISAAASAIKITLGKYNSERRLTILYKHREKVLQQYKGFEAGIGEDAEAKNEFRMEIAKYIFSDPSFEERNNENSKMSIGPSYKVIEKIIK